MAPPEGGAFDFLRKALARIALAGNGPLLSMVLRFAA
jgi:hypothetical protein